MTDGSSDVTMPVDIRLPLPMVEPAVSGETLTDSGTNRRPDAESDAAAAPAENDLTHTAVPPWPNRDARHQHAHRKQRNQRRTSAGHRGLRTQQVGHDGEQPHRR